MKNKRSVRTDLQIIYFFSFHTTRVYQSLSHENYLKVRAKKGFKRRDFWKFRAFNWNGFLCDYYFTVVELQTGSSNSCSCFSRLCFKLHRRISLDPLRITHRRIPFSFRGIDWLICFMGYFRFGSQDLKMLLSCFLTGHDKWGEEIWFWWMQPHCFIGGWALSSTKEFLWVWIWIFIYVLVCLRFENLINWGWSRFWYWG